MSALRNLVVQLTEGLIVRAHYIFFALVPVSIVFQFLRAERSKEILASLLEKPGWKAGYIPFWQTSAVWLTNVGVFVFFAVFCCLLKHVLCISQGATAYSHDPGNIVGENGSGALRNGLPRVIKVLGWALIIALVILGIFDVVKGIQTYGNIDRSIATRAFLSIEHAAKKLFLAATLYYLLELAIALGSRQPTSK